MQGVLFFILLDKINREASTTPTEAIQGIKI